MREIGGQDHGHVSAQSVTNQRAVAGIAEWAALGTLLQNAWDRELVGMYGRWGRIFRQRFKDGGWNLDHERVRKALGANRTRS